jgi:hypothetical protein
MGEGGEGSPPPESGNEGRETLPPFHINMGTPPCLMIYIPDGYHQSLAGGHGMQLQQQQQLDVAVVVWQTQLSQECSNWAETFRSGKHALELQMQSPQNHKMLASHCGSEHVRQKPQLKTRRSLTPSDSLSSEPTSFASEQCGKNQRCIQSSRGQMPPNQPSSSSR